MERVWNISPDPIVLDWSVPAIRPGEPAWVTDEQAVELAANPLWSLENPRKPKQPDRLQGNARTGEKPEVEVPGGRP